MAFRSGSTYRAFRDFDCELCFCTIWEGDEFGYVDGEKACENCWDVAREDEGWDL
jgi:hypothetical protein